MAISIVHFLGMPVDMDRINQIAKKHNLFVVEDAALAVGTYYKGKHAGLLGDVGCFSFYPVKHFTTAEGGMLITKDEAIATSGILDLRLHSYQGLDPAARLYITAMGSVLSGFNSYAPHNSDILFMPTFSEGSGDSGNTVPEPSGIVMACAGFLGLVWKGYNNKGGKK